MLVLYWFPPSIDTDKSIAVPKKEGGGGLTCFKPRLPQSEILKIHIM